MGSARSWKLDKKSQYVRESCTATTQASTSAVDVRSRRVLRYLLLMEMTLSGR